MIYIGIDPGVHTGCAVWASKDRIFTDIKTLKLHQAWYRVKDLYLRQPNSLIVIVEDARLRNWFGKKGREVLQGAGSIKRDCGAWDDFLTDEKIPHRFVPPKDNITRIDEQYFVQLTKWGGRTSVHSRAAAMLVYGR
jgi:hypothetical protein